MQYSELARRHMMAPRNLGALENASVVAVAGREDGPFLRLYLRLSDDQRIQTASFETYNCPAGMAAGSMLTEMLIGKSLREAFQMTPEELDEALGGLPANKKFCAGLAIEALRRAIVFWTNHGSAKPGNP